MSGQTKFIIALGLLFVLGYYTAPEEKVEQKEVKTIIIHKFNEVK